jgi:hypothetical protein
MPRMVVDQGKSDCLGFSSVSILHRPSEGNVACFGKDCRTTVMTTSWVYEPMCAARHTISHMGGGEALHRALPCPQTLLHYIHVLYIITLHMYNIYVM